MIINGRLVPAENSASDSSSEKIASDDSDVVIVSDEERRETHPPQNVAFESTSLEDEAIANIEAAAALKFGNGKKSSNDKQKAKNKRSDNEKKEKRSLGAATSHNFRDNDNCNKRISNIANKKNATILPNMQNAKNANATAAAATIVATASTSSFSPKEKEDNDKKNKKKKKKNKNNKKKDATFIVNTKIDKKLNKKLALASSLRNNEDDNAVTSPSIFARNDCNSFRKGNSSTDEEEDETRQKPKSIDYIVIDSSSSSSSPSPTPSSSSSSTVSSSSLSSIAKETPSLCFDDDDEVMKTNADLVIAPLATSSPKDRSTSSGIDVIECSESSADFINMIKRREDRKRAEIVSKLTFDDVYEEEEEELPYNQMYLLSQEFIEQFEKLVNRSKENSLRKDSDIAPKFAEEFDELSGDITTLRSSLSKDLCSSEIPLPPPPPPPPSTSAIKIQTNSNNKKEEEVKSKKKDDKIDINAELCLTDEQFRAMVVEISVSNASLSSILETAV